MGNPKNLNKWKRTDYRALRKIGFRERRRYTGTACAGFSYYDVDLCKCHISIGQKKTISGGSLHAFTRCVNLECVNFCKLLVHIYKNVTIKLGLGELCNVRHNTKIYQTLL